MQRRMMRKRSGFTLIEVLLVAGILALLAAFAVPRIFSQAEDAKRKLAAAGIGRNGPIGKALDAYKWAMGKFPDTDEGLAALYVPKTAARDERYDGPYMEGVIEELKDPWGHPFVYKSPGDVNEDSYDLYSVGANGQDDGGKEGSDDIKNWVER